MTVGQTSWRTARSARQLRGAIVLAACLTMAACGGSAASPGSGGVSAVPSPASPSPSPSPSSTASTGMAELTIRVNDGSGKVSTWRLTCDPAGGTHPDPAAACRALDKSGATALPATARGIMCAQHTLGPATATVSGIWRGQAVNSRLSLRNGCEIGRWQALVGLLPPISYQR